MSSTDQAPLCVLCGRRPVERAWRPFCSELCKLKDLARWADGSYRVPGERTGDTERGGHLEAASPPTDQ